MDQVLFDDVFIRGIIGNRTTRRHLPEAVLFEYTRYCEQLVSENQELKRQFLYERASDFLEGLLNNNDEQD